MHWHFYYNSANTGLDTPCAFLQLRYPPVLDKRLSDAAAHLEAIMKDFAQTNNPVDPKTGDAASVPRVNSTVKERLATLPDKIKQLLHEGSQNMDADKNADNSGSDMPEIDSGTSVYC